MKQTREKLNKCLSVFIAVFILFSGCAERESEDVVPFHPSLYLTYDTNFSQTPIRIDVRVHGAGKWEFDVDTRNPFKNSTKHYYNDYGLAMLPSQEAIAGVSIEYWLPKKYRVDEIQTIEEILLPIHFDKKRIVIEHRLWKQWDVFVVETKEEEEHCLWYYESETGWLVEKIVKSGKLYGQKGSVILIDSNANIPLAATSYE